MAWPISFLMLWYCAFKSTNGITSEFLAKFYHLSMQGHGFGGSLQNAHNLEPGFAIGERLTSGLNRVHEFPHFRTQSLGIIESGGPHITSAIVDAQLVDLFRAVRNLNALIVNLDFL